MPTRNPKPLARRVPRFSAVPAKPSFYLPPRVNGPVPVVPKPGYHTYYLSCDKRSFEVYLPHAVKQFRRGFRAAMLAPAGLVADPPSVVILGLQDGDTFEHAAMWVTNNPIDEIRAQAVNAKDAVALKDQQRAQKRFAKAVASLEGVLEAQKEAEAELEAATAEIIAVQGVEALVIDGVYFDPTYSREKVYLKKRDPRFNPVQADDDDEEPLKPRRTSKKSGRAA